MPASNLENFSDIFLNTSPMRKNERTENHYLNGSLCQRDLDLLAATQIFLFQ